MDRRITIADAAIGVIADAGLRALTHRRLDETLNLAGGSTSYYFRTKSELVDAVADRITAVSREQFRGAFDAGEGDVTEVTVSYLSRLLSDRAAQLRARQALLLDVGVDAAARVRLQSALFSVSRAEDLFGDRAVADGYVALCEGLVVVALGSGWTPDSLRIPLATYLKGSGRA